MTARRIIKRPQIHDLGQLCEAVGVGQFHELEKAVFKGTTCGAYVVSEAGQVVVGSIVEGVDYGTEYHILVYPFTLSDFWEALEKVELEAEEIWNDTHGCDDCGEEDPWTGSVAINPECKTCEGEGVVI
jgi:hypothetical protein